MTNRIVLFSWLVLILIINSIILQVLLAANFFSHFGFDNNFPNNEYETDILLEYDDSDIYEEFKEFFYDVLPEFEKFGRVVQFKVS